MTVLLQDKDERPILGRVGQVPTSVDPEADSSAAADNSAGMTFDAAFRLENTVASFLGAAEEVGEQGLVDPEFDPFEEIEGFEEDAPAFAFANTPGEVNRIKGKINRERADRRTVEESGVMGVVAMLTAGMIDPVNLIPVGGVAYKSYRLGGSILRAAGVTARAGLLSSTAAEAVLQHSQITRTWGEGAANITAGTLLSGILGSAVVALRPLSKGGRMAAKADIARKLDRDMMVPHPDEPDPIIPGSIRQSATDFVEETGGSVGAAATRSTTKAEEGLKSALGLEKVVKFQDPMLRGATSPSVEMRRIMPRLGEQVLMQEKNAAGIETSLSVEARMAQHNYGLSVASRSLDNGFVTYRAGRSKRFGDIPAITLSDLGRSARRRGKLSYAEFKDEVGHAMRNKDEHPIAEVAEVARAYRKNVFDPLKDDAVRLGLLPEDVDVKTAPSYLMRVYDAQKIMAERPAFKRKIEAYLQNRRDQSFDNIGNLGAEIDRIAGDLSNTLAERGRLRSIQRQAETGLRAKRERLKRDVQAGAKGLREAEGDLRREAARHAEFAPTEKLDADDPLKQLLRDARRGIKKPQGLLSWLKSRGGIQDQGGELSIFDLHKARPGLISKNGMTLDEAAGAAGEEGFFPLHGGERPEIDDLIEAMRDEVAGVPVVRDSDIDVLASMDELENFTQALDEVGIVLGDMKDEEVVAILRAIETGDAPGFRADTPANRARAREIANRVRGIERKIKAKDAEVVAVRDDLEQAGGDLAAVRGKAARVRDTVETLEKEANKLRTSRKALRKDLSRQEFHSGFDDQDLASVADEIIDRILGSPVGRLPYDLNMADAAKHVASNRPAGFSAPLKGRSFLIDDADIEEFLVSDIERVASSYTRSMAADVEMIREFGDLNMTAEKKAVALDYDRKMANPELTPKKRAALERRKGEDLRDMDAVRQRLLGIYKHPDNPDGYLFRMGRTVKSLNYLRLLGGMTASAFPDTARPIMVHGLRRVVGDGLIPMIKNFKAFRLSAEELKRAGTALDMDQDTRAMLIADVMDDFGRHSKFERGVQGLQKNFGIVSLMAPWNAAMKQFSGLITMNRMIRAMRDIADVPAGKAIPKRLEKEVEKLASQGINPEMARKIIEQHGDKIKDLDGVMVANTADWTGPGSIEMQVLFRGAVKKEVDKIIVTPGQDKPLWMSTQLGGIVGQFKSFSMASTTRTMLSGLQQRDLAALNGAALSVGLGSLVYAFKNLDAGRELSDDPAVWISEGLDRSGLFGWFFDVNNFVEKATRGSVGVNAMIGGPPMSRYVSRNAVGALLGPSLGFGQDLVGGVIPGLASGEWTQSDTRALRRLLPYQNLIGFRRLLDKAEVGINDAIGARK